MKVVSLDQVTKTKVDMEGAEKVCKQVPVGQSDGSPAFSIRVFSIEPYGDLVVVRTYDPVTDEWRKMDRFVGKLRPFETQPFSYRIRAIYKEKMGVDVPDGALFLALYDVPKPNGWQIAAIVLATVLSLGAAVGFVALLYSSVRRKHKQPVPDGEGQAEPGGAGDA